MFIRPQPERLMLSRGQFSEEGSRTNVHKNARLTPRSRAVLVRRVLQENQRPAVVPQAMGVSVRTAAHRRKPHLVCGLVYVIRRRLFGTWRKSSTGSPISKQKRPWSDSIRTATVCTSRCADPLHGRDSMVTCRTVRRGRWTRPPCPHFRRSRWSSNILG
jgi:hypothetical protein